MARRSFYLAGYKVHNDGKTWQEQFKTKLFDRTVGKGFYNLNAKISTVSNEMLVVGTANDVMVFVIDLNKDKNVCRLVTPTATYERNKETHIHILETSDVMYIVTSGTKTDNRYFSTHINEVRVNYAYKLHSKQLETIDSIVASICELDKTREDEFPCLSKASTSVGDGLWYMEGNDDKASSLTKVSVDKDKNPVIEHHTPPPFPIVTALVAGRISCQILENKKPVTRYFGNE